MTIQIKHAFVSAKGDGGDATLVRPSNWNAVHSTSMASGQLIGRLTAGVGVFEEIPISAYMAGLLAAPDAATLAGLLGLFDTGDVKYTFKTSAPAGWIFMQGGLGVGAGNGCTIGSAASGAVIRANADTLPLYTLIWNGCSDAVAPVSGGRGASAAADFAANKMLTVPYLTGRSPIGAGAATASAGLSARNLGQSYGEENHLLLTSEMPSHFHSAGISDPGHTHGHNALTGSTTTGGGAFGAGGNGAATISAALTGVRVMSPNGLDTTYSAGGGAVHNTIHPVMALNVLVKL
jgi:microcystin-dependent protein